MPHSFTPCSVHCLSLLAHLSVDGVSLSSLSHLRLSSLSVSSISDQIGVLLVSLSRSSISDQIRSVAIAVVSLSLENLDKLIKTNSSGCKWFAYDVIKTSTSQFSLDKLIDNGGYNRVYKGLLPGGKPVAVKVLKSSKEACKDFTQEVDIMSSLKHKNITPLLGICVEDNELISVYDFLSGGNLEENLHGNSKETSVLSWELRFKPAVEIVEALNYLHNECSRPVIHRDVKSSNILLSNEFEPKVVVMTVENLYKCFNPQCICFRCYRIDCCFILLLAITSTPYDMDGT